MALNNAIDDACADDDFETADGLEIKLSAVVRRLGALRKEAGRAQTPVSAALDDN